MKRPYVKRTTTASALTESQIQDLITQSLQARQYSYSPYSKFRVGAALLSAHPTSSASSSPPSNNNTSSSSSSSSATSGKIFQGCNVENAAYGGAICAERTAFVKAISEGHLRFLALAVSCDWNQFMTPCGICRQFMYEFGQTGGGGGGGLEIFLVRDDRSYRRAHLEDLLPFGFGPEAMPPFEDEEEVVEEVEEEEEEEDYGDDRYGQENRRRIDHARERYDHRENHPHQVAYDYDLKYEQLYRKGTLSALATAAAVASSSSLSSPTSSSSSSVSRPVASYQYPRQYSQHQSVASPSRKHRKY